MNNPIYNINRFVLQGSGDFTWRVSDCEELVGVAHRIEEDGVIVAYVTDNELEPPGKVHTSYDEWVAFCSGVDVLIHDAQYTEADMPNKHGWGHSLMSQVRQLAIDAEVGSLVMFHHDPDRSDVQLDEIQRENDSFFKGKSSPARS